MKRRTFLVSVDGAPVGHAFAYNSALRKGEAAIRAALPTGGSAEYVSGYLDRETMCGYKLYRRSDGRMSRVDVRIDSPA